MTRIDCDTNCLTCAGVNGALLSHRFLSSLLTPSTNFFSLLLSFAEVELSCISTNFKLSEANNDRTKRINYSIEKRKKFSIDWFVHFRSLRTLDRKRPRVPVSERCNNVLIKMEDKGSLISCDTYN
jgi:hypothetical protein